ncbi:hypothetical protein PLICRDRAFT_53383 [Plicaturopsis crispa FD-325 SS-3]|nr:hypothetical protein PLICRDRAFT_53383 [Plicaturopsis crispa FD-325 SS-3]
MPREYWYPSMNPDELIAAITGWGFPVSHEQLLRPTPDFVIAIYTACLEQVTSLSYNALDEPLQNALATLEDPNADIYSSSMAQNLILYHIARMAEAAKVPDFNSRDLYMPYKERTCNLLSAFVNFVKFTEQCVGFVSGVRAKSLTLIEERQKVARELEEIQQKCDEIKSRRAEDGPRCESLKKENDALTIHLLAARDNQTALVKDIETLKVEKASVMQSKENLNRDVSLATDSITRTRSRIVQSPERIKRTISTMGTTALEDKRTLAMHETKARDLQAKITALGNIEKDVRACVEQLQTLEKEIVALDAAQKDLAELKDHDDDKKIEKTELNMKQERVQKQMSNAVEKFERAQRHAEDKRVANQHTIDRLQREYEEMALERRHNDKEVEEVKGEADEVEAKMAEHLRRSEAELNELLSEYWTLRHQTEVYMETLANKLGMQVSAD